MAILGINTSEIKHDLSKYYDMFSSMQKDRILQSFESLEDYVNVLYWLRFVKKYDYNEMNKITGFKQFYVKYYFLGWHYSNSFEENEILRNNEISKLESIKQKAFTIRDIDINQDISEYYKLSTHMREYIYKRFGFKSSKQYIRAMYYLVKIEKLSSIELSYMFNTAVKTIQNRLASLNLNRDLAEAQQIAVQQGRRDYDKVFRTGRTTTQKRFLSDSLFGSNLENSARALFELILPEYIDTNIFDIVVGINTRSIVIPYEIDIPIMVININSNKVHKFAIEFNGDHAHKGTNSRDNKKIELINNRGWKYLSVWQYHSTKIQKDHGSIEEQIRNICVIISDLVDDSI